MGTFKIKIFLRYQVTAAPAEPFNFPLMIELTVKLPNSRFDRKIEHEIQLCVVALRCVCHGLICYL